MITSSQVNDRFGHDAGDRMLAAFAGVAEQSVRPTDQLFRMGGEEFCFVLPDTPLKGALEVAERIRKRFRARSRFRRPRAWRRPPSASASPPPITRIDLELLLAAADAAVYEAKARGRNRVVVAEPTAIPRAPLA